jgi:hypothetical protein
MRNFSFLAALAGAVGIATITPTAARTQELGAYVGGGVGGIRDVRRPFGGGLEGTWLFHDWIGVRADAGWYWTLEHRTTLECTRGAGEAIVCTSVELSSHSHFPQFDGLLMLRGHIPGKGIRIEGGVGPTWINVTNEIRTSKDSVYSPQLSSSAAGLMLMAGVLFHPPWQAPIDFETAYAYHMTGRFGACSTITTPTGVVVARPNDPLCNQRLNFHELRLSLFYRFGQTPR